MNQAVRAQHNQERQQGGGKRFIQNPNKPWLADVSQADYEKRQDDLYLASPRGHGKTSRRTGRRQKSREGHLRQQLSEQAAARSQEEEEQQGRGQTFIRDPKQPWLADVSQAVHERREDDDYLQNPTEYGGTSQVGGTQTMRQYQLKQELKQAEANRAKGRERAEYELLKEGLRRENPTIIKRGSEFRQEDEEEKRLHPKKTRQGRKVEFEGHRVRESEEKTQPPRKREAEEGKTQPPRKREAEEGKTQPPRERPPTPANIYGVPLDQTDPLPKDIVNLGLAAIRPGGRKRRPPRPAHSPDPSPPPLSPDRARNAQRLRDIQNIDLGFATPPRPPRPQRDLGDEKIADETADRNRAILAAREQEEKERAAGREVTPPARARSPSAVSPRPSPPAQLPAQPAQLPAQLPPSLQHQTGPAASASDYTGQLHAKIDPLLNTLRETFPSASQGAGGVAALGRGGVAAAGAIGGAVSGGVAALGRKVRGGMTAAGEYIWGRGQNLGDDPGGEDDPSSPEYSPRSSSPSRSPQPMDPNEAAAYSRRLLETPERIFKGLRGKTAEAHLHVLDPLEQSIIDKGIRALKRPHDFDPRRTTREDYGDGGGHTTRPVGSGPLGQDEEETFPPSDPRRDVGGRPHHRPSGPGGVYHGHVSDVASVDRRHPNDMESEERDAYYGGLDDRARFAQEHRR